MRRLLQRVELSGRAAAALAAVLVLGTAHGCAESERPRDTHRQGAAGLKLFAQEDPLAEIFEADRQFAIAVAEGGLDAWVAAFDEGGAILTPSGPVPVGHDAIRETMASDFAKPGFSLGWEPLGGAVSASGDHAYTFGDYETRNEGEVVARGRYVTVWRRGEDGVWRVLSDIGNRDLGDLR